MRAGTLLVLELLVPVASLLPRSERQEHKDYLGPATQEVQRSAQKWLQRPNNPQELTCHQKKQTGRLDRDSKWMGNSSLKACPQAIPADEMVVRTIDLREQIGFGGPRPGPGKLPC